MGKKYGVIYILYVEDGKGIRYVGKTEGSVPGRLIAHRKEHKRSYKCNWVKSVGPENVHILVIKHVLLKDLYDAEQNYIRIFRKLGFKLTNATDGGPGRSGSRNPDETIMRHSEFMRKLPRTPEWCANIKRGLQDAIWPPCTPERALKISAANKGQKRPKVSEKQRGVPWSPARRDAHENTPDAVVVERNRKMSEMKKNTPQTPAQIAGHKRRTGAPPTEAQLAYYARIRGVTKPGPERGAALLKKYRETS
jgi:hypothetical protein